MRKKRKLTSIMILNGFEILKTGLIFNNWRSVTILFIVHFNNQFDVVKYSHYLS